MITIEKTQINISAMIGLVGTLKEINSGKIIKISEDQKSVTIRDRNEDEYEDFKIDLQFLDEIFSEVVNPIRRTLEFNDDAEKYLKNCSFACSYYRPKNHSAGKFDHFELFHSIHFEEIKDSEDEVMKYFCRLFRIDDDVLNDLNNCSATDAQFELKSDGAFNHYFKTLIVKKKNNILSYHFITDKIEYQNTVEILFILKDLLINRGYDVSQIPNIQLFSMRQGETLFYNFNLGHIKMTIEMENYKMHIKFEKNCQ